MGELKVEMASEKEIMGTNLTPKVEKRSSNVHLVLTLLAGTAILAAAVYYPNACIVQDLRHLISRLENFTAEEKTELPDITSVSRPQDCYDISKNSTSASTGVYKIFPGNTKRGYEVICDMGVDEGGWLVIQRREDGSLDFSRDWNAYQFGFQNGTSEFWIGNEFLHLITTQGVYELRIDMEDFDGHHRFAKYKVFHVASREMKFKLTVGGYSGNAGDSLGSHNGMMFSTKDNDNDLASGSCATSFKGGFWYNNCHLANPNGRYLKGNHESLADGVNWYTWREYKYSLKTFSMKIKPV